MGLFGDELLRLFDDVTIIEWVGIALGEGDAYVGRKQKLISMGKSCLVCSPVQNLFRNHQPLDAQPPMNCAAAH